MQTQSYTLKIEGFEGPFGLLLDLIERRKLSINDLALAAVTEDFLKHVNKSGNMQSGEVASFILVASTLILVKSKSLLPALNLTEEEKGDIKDLEERLRLYALFTKLGVEVRNNFGRKIIFAPLELPHRTVVFLPDSQITKSSMMTFAQNVLGAMPKKDFLPEAAVKKIISLEEMIEKLTDRIRNTIQLNFKDLHGKITNREEKIFAIVGFLAVLELVRGGVLNAVQAGNFEDIIIDRLEEIVN